MSEEELPNELNKLEIGPILPQMKLIDRNLPVSLNPFFNECNEALSESTIFGDIKCCCRMRRRSESVLDECKSNEANSPFSRTGHTIKNPMQFKHKNRKKIILREPILNSLQKCLHPKHLKAFGNIPGRFSNKSMSNVNAEHEFNKSCPTIEALNLDETVCSLDINTEETSTSCKKKWSGITDFRDLIAECQSLLDTSFSFTSWNASIASRKNLKNFNVIQTAENRLQRYKICNVNHRRSKVHNANLNKEEEGIKQFGSNSASTSCSQQARINASVVTARAHSSSITGTTSPCDVTIDELASYFETFVHIPKKMSSMAEMMYI